MTPADVRKRIRALVKFVEERDFEAAHSREDDLYRDVLVAIATSDENVDACVLRGLARAALKTQKLKFARWSA